MYKFFYISRIVSCSTTKALPKHERAFINNQNHEIQKTVLMNIKQKKHYNMPAKAIHSQSHISTKHASEGWHPS
jgi:hypothetical protein